MSSQGRGRGEVQRQPWSEKLCKLSGPTAPCGGRFLLIWESGSWAWLCDLEQRPLLLWPVFPSARWEWKGLSPISQAAFRIGLPSLPLDPSLSPLVALDVRPLWLPRLVPGPQHRLLSCSLPCSFCLSLSPPPSLPLLSCWALAFSSLLCVSGPPLQPDLVHIQMAAKVLCPLPAPTQAQGTRPCGELLCPCPHLLLMGQLV